MSRRFHYLLGVLAFAVFVPLLCGDTPEKRSKELMHRKLTHAQRVLEGLAINDFDKIIKSAEELMLLSKQNEWRVIDSPRYELHSNDFRRAIETVITKAREKNIDGAALGYVEMTLTCIRCHKHVREVRMTRIDFPANRDSVALK